MTMNVLVRHVVGLAFTHLQQLCSSFYDYVNVLVRHVVERKRGGRGVGGEVRRRSHNDVVL